MPTPETTHQTLHKLCQQASKLMEEDHADSEAAFHLLLNDLAVFARAHFAAEEERLRQTNPGQLDHQLAEHIEYENQLVDILVAASHGVLDKHRLHRFVTEWWSMHPAPPGISLRSATK